MTLKDKVALVTGASQGIGKACALALAEAGADIVLCSRNLEKLDQVARQIEGLQRRALVSGLDVSRPDQVKAVFTEAVQKLGRLDILVNNAAITKDTLLLRMKAEEWNLVVQTNLNGVFYCTQEAIKVMLRQRYGRIINITSVVGQTGNAGQANYVAAKAGVIGFTKSVAQEVASRNITVNAVAPGFIDTAMTQVLPEEIRSKLLEKIPLGRIGSDSEVAYGVRFLASDEASYITGHVLNINGGLYM
ncbi:MAG: 3-oxoacyl-[acyl-carrier-protein] reductase [Acidobacteriota bacterium]